MLEQPPYELVTAVSSLLFNIDNPLGHLNPSVPVESQLEQSLLRTNVTNTEININLTLDLGNFTYNQTNDTSGLPAKMTGRKQYSHCETFNFVVYGIVLGTFCLLGISGNTLSIFVLQRDKTNEVASFLLQALAVADNSVLLLSLIILSLCYGIVPYTSGSGAIRPVYPYIVKFIHPLGYMAQTLTIWTTVLLAINRFIAVCRPFHATTLCTIRKARYQIIGVVAFSLLFNFPRFFQTQIVTKTRKTDGEHFTSVTPTIIGERTMFGIIYTNAMYSILVLVLPFVLLAYLNIHLAVELRNMRKRRNSMSTTPAPRDQNITLVMVIIIVIFLICHMPDRILQGIKSFWTPEQTGCYSTIQNYTAVTNVLIAVNSSTNFLVYYFFRKRFRRILVMCLCCKDRQSRKYRLSSLSTNGLQQITLMSSLGAFDRDTVTNLHGSRLSLHSNLNNAVDKDFINNLIKSNSNSRMSLHRLSNVSNIPAREKLLIPPIRMNGHRHSH